jgi:hypothetical protein
MNSLVLRHLLACFVWSMGVFICAPQLVQAAPTVGTTTFPASGGFTTVGNQTSPRSVNYLGFTFTAASTSNVSISQASSRVNLLVSSGNPTYLGFASDDGSKFKLSSFVFDATNATYATTLTLTGYSGGAAVSGATSTLNVTASGTSNNFTWDVSAVTGFQNIDEVRITGPSSGTGGVGLFSITIQAAVLPAVAPTVTTSTSASIAATTATLGGNVTSDGGAAVTERGVVYSLTATNSNPIINGTGVVKATTSGTTGVFTVPVSSLTASSGYSFKAYATNSVGTSYSPVSTFTTLAPAPTVTSINTSSGPTAGGTSVTITGTNLSSATGVNFGANAATGLTANTATSITVTAPAGSAGTVDVTVTTAGGTSATNAGDQFTYVGAPTVTSLATTSGPTAGGTSVTITGTNLSAATGVKFGTTSATGLTANTATSITVTAPAGSAGTVDVTVTTAGGTSATGAADQFTYVAAPTIASVSSTKANGSYNTTVLVPITVTFSAAVSVTGTPTLALNSGGSASYASGSGTSTLTFNYTVGATDNATILDCSSTSSLALAGGTISATTGGTAANLTLPTPGGANSLGVNKAIVIDTTAPTIVSINRQTPSGQTTASNTVTFRVTYSEAVTVPGASNFSVVAVNGSSIVGTVTSVTGTGTTRDVTVTITSGTGEFRLRGVN